MGFEGRGHPAWVEYVPFKTHHRDNYEFWEHQSMEDMHHVFVHRLLAVASHGLEALQGKEVHHKNGIKWDNRPENIELLSPEQHRKRHHEQGDFPQSVE